MYEGTWTMRPCPRQEVRELAQALGLSETTASVLVRRGYGDPEKAKAFLAAEPPEHDPRLLGNVDEACASSTRRSPPAAASASTGTTTSTASARPRWPSPRSAAWARRSTGTFRAASRRATACLARPWRGWPARNVRSCSRSTAGSPRSRRSPRRAPPASRSSSPTTTGPARPCPTARSSPPAPPSTRSPSCAAPASSTSCSWRSAPRASTATSTSSPWRRWPTWFRSWTRTARS